MYQLAMAGSAADSSHGVPPRRGVNSGHSASGPGPSDFEALAVPALPPQRVMNTSHHAPAPVVPPDFEHQDLSPPRGTSHHAPAPVVPPDFEREELHLAPGVAFDNPSKSVSALAPALVKGHDFGKDELKSAEIPKEAALSQERGWDALADAVVALPPPTAPAGSLTLALPAGSAAGSPLAVGTSASGESSAYSLALATYPAEA